MYSGKLQGNQYLITFALMHNVYLEKVAGYNAEQFCLDFLRVRKIDLRQLLVFSPLS